MSSKGEDKIVELLSQNHIQFEREVSFPDLKSLRGNLLRFDFAVMSKGKLVALIEFDGEQHFHQVPYFHKTIMQFRQMQEWDRRKNDYCIRKKIPLIRVPYWDLEELTIDKLLKNPAYRVKDKFHNDLLNRR